MQLVALISDVDYIVTDSEVEALLLENRLIKKHTPRFNIDLRTGERYAYIKITADKFPRIMTARVIDKDGKLYGPYTDGTARRQMIDLAQRLFRLRTCRTLPKRVCLQYHIKRCDGPCEGKISAQQYSANLKRAAALLDGKTSELSKQLEQDMLAASAAKNFELALERRDQLYALEHISERQKIERSTKYDQDVIAIAYGENKVLIQVFNVKKGILLGKEQFSFDDIPAVLDQFVAQYYEEHAIPSEVIVGGAIEDPQTLQSYLIHISEHPVKLNLKPIGTKRGLLELAQKNADVNLESGSVALVDLQEKLKLADLPRVIEGFDISHLGGSGTVASMVQLPHGVPNKSEYRHYTIKSATNDDYKSMHEVVSRRYSRLTREGKPLPNLILIDGGAGQVAAAYKAMKSQGINIPLVGLAKKEEVLHFPNFRFPVKLSKKSDALKLLQYVRDESHRFAKRLQVKKRKIK